MMSTDVYTGLWINWSYGRVQGSTLTLTAGNSAFLVAFVALWVRFVGGQLWTVLTYLASITRSSTSPQDALYHQQQAILRNTAQPSGVMWAMLKLSWFWKGTAKRARTRSFRFVFACLAYLTAFAVAGIFSSKLSSTNSEVLLIPSPYCGRFALPSYTAWLAANDTTYQEWSINNSQYHANLNALFHQSHVYVSQCYNENVRNTNNPCLPFGKSQITWNTTRNVTCPYDEDMCIAPAIQFDTGFLRSDIHFGINTRNVHIEYRKVMTCAPITTKGYVAGYFSGSELNSSLVHYEDETFLTYSYGQSVFFNDTTTYAFSNHSFDSDDGYWPAIQIYNIDTEWSCANTTGYGPDQSFTPIDKLSREDSDITMLFLSKNASYLSEVLDPWFRATVPEYANETTVDPSGNTVNHIVDWYQTDEANTVVACAEQHQLRNPNNGGATPLGGLEFLMQEQAQAINFTDDQMTLYLRSFYGNLHNTMNDVVPSLGGTYLLASANQDSTRSTGLPDNQWELEFEHYFGVGMIAMELKSQQFVTGLVNPALDSYITPATPGFQRDMCTRQIVRRTDHRSFSVLGLCLIFIIGFLFIVANWWTESTVSKLQKNTEEGRYRNAEWQANDFLQLQRMTYQHNNTGTWTGEKEKVPRTNPGELFTLPASTQWNHYVSDPVEDVEKGGLKRKWNRATRPRSYNPPNDQSPNNGVPEIVVDEKSTVCITETEKVGAEISETQVKL